MYKYFVSFAFSGAFNYFGNEFIELENKITTENHIHDIQHRLSNKYCAPINILYFKLIIEE